MTMNPYIICKKIRFSNKIETKLFTPYEEQANKKEVKEATVIKEETVIEEETVIDEETGLVAKAYPPDEDCTWGYLTQPDVEVERQTDPDVEVEPKNLKSVDPEDLMDEELVMYHFQDQI